MPAAAVLGYANRKVPQLTKGQCLAIGVMLFIAGALIFEAMRQTRGGVPVPAATTEAIKPFTVPPGFPIVGPNQHLNGYVYTPHRYPVMTGQEITTVINRGHATLKLPHAADTGWIVAPPSEETL